jgi:aryl-alcohol dehydrogenase-like predicted oxidoreductase
LLPAKNQTAGAAPEGTAAYVRRHPGFAPDFFRATTFELNVSSLGIGTYLGDSTDADDAAYVNSVRHAVASGLNLIDTAINYRCQRSERAVGVAIRQAIESGSATREEIVVCSKAGYIPLELGLPRSRPEYQEYVRRQFLDTEILRAEEIVAGGHSLAPRFLKYCIAKSRQNLGLRSIDVYYVHNPGQQLADVSREELRTRLRAAFLALEEAVNRGEIGVYGCATWNELRVPMGAPEYLSLEDLVALACEVAGKEHHFRAVQLPLNLAMTEAVRLENQPLRGRTVSALTAASELGLTVVASATLMQSKLAADLPQALRDAFPQCETDAQRAIAFTRSLPGVTSALVGMKRVEHVDENTTAARR